MSYIRENRLVIKAKWKLKKVICLGPVCYWFFNFLDFQRVKIILLVCEMERETVNGNI